MKITNSKKNVNASQYIRAAEGDDPFDDMGFDDEEMDMEAGELEEDVDDAADSLEDMSDTLDELNDALQGIKEDDVDIEIDNNIADHYIAECDKCHNVFITSVMVSDQDLEMISGICPICDEESDQYLKWVIKDVKSLYE